MSVSDVLRAAVFLISVSLSAGVLAAGEPLAFPPELLRDIRDAPIPVRVCPEATAVQCASEFYKLADDQLNVVYSAARKQLKSHGQLHEEQNLVRAQRAWIQFRDAHCTYAGEKMAQGTGLNSFHAIACMEVETIRRTYYLQPHSR
ncbi:lysozyme inhibitor LprI family protein [Curvibacter sp. PAE-UM]|uniref:lysozyme inhibitor LprI family protein n=1 Tax=Curvibacter sp. PAE-UM TaxID=1714344 RepID=UPI0009EA49F6